jgi:UDP-GlcNAc:undecaprenyl-phosphate GlcNAc-1-phosphate transferase
MKTTPIIHFFILVTAAVTSTILVPFVARLSVSIGGIDEPGPRKIHSMSVPRLGGVAIFCAFLFTSIYFCEIGREVKGLLTGAMVIFATGLVDDLFGLTPRQKLVGQFIAASLAVLIGDLYVRNLGNPFGLGVIELGQLAIPFTVFGIVGMINAINLLDGMDGLAGGVCTIVCVDFAVLAYTTRNMELFALSIALLGGLLGFMRYNSHPAIIFMGDAGSLLLGYCMGVFAVLLVNGGELAVSPYIPLLLLGLPVMDTLVVMVNRFRAGKSAFLPDKTHIHHRLMDMGLGQKAIVLIVYGITYLLSLIAIFGRHLSDTQLLLLLLSITITVYGLVHHLTHNANWLKWFSRQSNKSLRKVAVLRLRVQRCCVLLTSMKYVMLAILIMPALLPDLKNRMLPLLPLLLLGASACFYLLHRTWRDLTLQAFIYASGVFMIFAMENLGHDEVLPGVPLKAFSHILFGLLLCCVLATIALRNRASKLLVSPFEYLIMLIVLSTPLLPAALISQYHLLTVAAKSVLLFIGFKLVLMQQMQRNRKVLLAIVLSMSAIVCRFVLES